MRGITTGIRAEIRDLLPPYYIKNSTYFPQKDIQLAKAAWDHIIKDTSPEFLRQKSAVADFPRQSCLMWFYDTFYAEFQSLDEAARAVYQGGNLKVQAKALMGMINMIISVFLAKDSSSRDSERNAGRRKSESVRGSLFQSQSPSDKNIQLKSLAEKRAQTLEALAKGHTKIGVKAYQYVLMGQVLLSSLAKCLGDTVWTRSVRLVWARMFSCILDCVLPVALKCEKALLKTRATAEGSVAHSSNGDSHSCSSSYPLTERTAHVIAATAKRLPISIHQSGRIAPSPPSPHHNHDGGPRTSTGEARSPNIVPITMSSPLFSHQRGNSMKDFLPALSNHYSNSSSASPLLPKGDGKEPAKSPFLSHNKVSPLLEAQHSPAQVSTGLTATTSKGVAGCVSIAAVQAGVNMTLSTLNVTNVPQEVEELSPAEGLTSCPFIFSASFATTTTTTTTLSLSAGLQHCATSPHEAALPFLGVGSCSQVGGTNTASIGGEKHHDPTNTNTDLGLGRMCPFTTVMHTTQGQGLIMTS